MRVLLVTHEASRSGAPRVAVLVARALVEQGHSVRVLSRAPGPLLADFAAAGIETAVLAVSCAPAELTRVIDAFAPT